MAMIGDVMRYVNNYFNGAAVEGEFSISDDGTMEPADKLDGARFIAIHGSAALDGVWALVDGTLDTDGEAIIPETFTGTVWPLRPPRDFVKLCERIAEFEAKTPVTAVQSESFGAYSHTMFSGKNGGAVTWQEAFAPQLVRYRRMFTEVEC